MIDFELSRNFDGTYNLVIYLRQFNYEFAQDIYGSDELRNFAKNFAAKHKTIFIKTVKLVFSYGVVITLPFSSLIRADAADSFAMSYVYFGSTENQIENVRRSSKVIDTVSPAYFNLHSDGSLDLSSISVNFINELQTTGLKIVPFLSNHWNRSIGNAALDNGESLAKTIAAAIKKYNLDGINVDIENVDHTYRDKYTAFVKALRENIPPEKEVSVAVAPNPYGWTNGWQGSYDYAKLGYYADYLMMMTYDEHYESGEPGPVSSIDFVRNSIDYALEYVSPEKLVIGVPFYGRIWGGNLKGEGASLNKIENIINTYRAEIFYDDARESVCAKFTVFKDSPETYVNGKLLLPDTYVIWYENETSLAKKFKLAADYDLKGVGNWSTGQEKNSSIWDYYELWLSGIYFCDIINHFAKDDIIKVSLDGIMIGKSDTEFAPSDKLSRGEAAVIIARVLGISPEKETVFPDTKNHFANGYISALYKRGLVNGFDDGTFKPNRHISRAEIAAMLARIAEPAFHTYSINYNDVSPSLWSFDEISALTSAGIMQGYSDGTFKPANAVSRGEMAALVNRIKERGLA